MAYVKLSGVTMKQTNLFLYCFLSILSLASAHAAEKVYSMGHSVVIVADNSDWTVETRHNPRYIKGKHKCLPIEFSLTPAQTNKSDKGDLTKEEKDEIEIDKKREISKRVVNFLSFEGIKSATVFNHVYLAEEKPNFFHIAGNFQDNNSKGFFAYYLFQNKEANDDHWFQVLIKLGEGSFDQCSDECSIESTFQEVFGLVQSVVSTNDPTALGYCE